MMLKQWLLPCLLVGVAACARNIEPTPELATVAIEWLMLVDDQRYDDAWLRAASILRSTVTRADWAQTMARVRQPLGDNIGRVLRSAHARTDPANSPRGDYVLLTYDSAFAADQVVETLTLYKEADGQWRISGYFVK